MLRRIPPRKFILESWGRKQILKKFLELCQAAIIKKLNFQESMGLIEITT